MRLSFKYWLIFNMMYLWSKFVTWLEDRHDRKVLGGFTRRELVQFRKDCVNLCVPTGTVFHVKHPGGLWSVEFYPSALPRFEWCRTKYNLQFPKDNYPYWDVTTSDGEIRRFDLNDDSGCARFGNAILKEFVRYFPFAPEPLTGDPIA